MVNDIIQKTAIDRQLLMEDCAEINALTHGQLRPSNLMNEIREEAASKLMRLARKFQSSVELRKKFYYIGRHNSLRSG